MTGENNTNMNDEKNNKKEKKLLSFREVKIMMINMYANNILN